MPHFLSINSSFDEVRCSLLPTEMRRTFHLVRILIEPLDSCFLREVPGQYQVCLELTVNHSKKGKLFFSSWCLHTLHQKCYVPECSYSKWRKVLNLNEREDLSAVTCTLRLVFRPCQANPRAEFLWTISHEVDLSSVSF